MNLRTNLVRRATTVVLGLSLAFGLAGTAPVTAADGDPGAPPVARDDVVEVLVGSAVELDLLANDEDPDTLHEDLSVCRVDGLPHELRLVRTDGGGASAMLLMAEVFEARTFAFTYYACDRHSLTPATVTVNVVEPPKVRIRVTKTERPGRLRVTNRGDFGLRFLWGKYDNRRPDGKVRVPSHSSTVIKVQRRSILWLALNVRREAFRMGAVRGIDLPRGSVVLAPGAPPRDAVFAERRLGTHPWAHTP